MRHKRERLTYKLKALLWTTVGFAVLNGISGVIQLAMGRWTGLVGLACCAALLALAYRQLRLYRLLGEPPKGSGPVQG